MPIGEKLELSLRSMKFDEFSSYRSVARRGAHLRQFCVVGSNDLGWRS
jgi:hypothetical protein